MHVFCWQKSERPRLIREDPVHRRNQDAACTTDSVVHATRAKKAALAITAAMLILLPSCGSFGRKFNDALPEFLQRDPGADEIARYRRRVQVLKRTEEEKAQAKEAYLAVTALTDQGIWDDAADALILYLEDFPDTEDDKNARFLLIRALLEDDNPFEASEAIRTFIATYPISEFNDRVEEVTFRLAIDYLEGEHDFFIFGKQTDGERLLRDLVLNFPNGRFADTAHWRLGNYHYDEGNYIEAEASYGAIVEKLSESPWASRAQFNRGLCRLIQVKGPMYDQLNMEAAEEDFREYLRRFPEGDKRAQAEAHIKNLINLMAEKQVSIARWYLGQDKPLAARLFLVRTVSRYGETPAATEARALLAELPADSDEIFKHLTTPADADGEPEKTEGEAGEKKADPGSGN